MDRMMTVDSPAGVLLLRPETDAERDFCFQLFRDSRPLETFLAHLPAELRVHLMRDQFNAQTQGYRAQAPDAAFSIIEHAGAAIGRIVLDRVRNAISIMDLAIVPAQRSRGFGSAIMRNLIQEGQATGMPVCLTAAVDNTAALRLYTRLGFAVTAQTPAYVGLVRYPLRPFQS
jgi:ribosomal protein S18 acetylase RimI-like enzyme